MSVISIAVLFLTLLVPNFHHTAPASKNPIVKTMASPSPVCTTCDNQGGPGY